MRPYINEELIKRVVDKWKQENRISIEIPKSRIIEDVLLRYLEGSTTPQEVKDRKRNKIFRTFIMMKSKIKPNITGHNQIKINSIEFGSITINNKKYNSDVIVSYKGSVQRVNTQLRHLISRREFNLMLAEEPEIIVIGTGIEGDMQVSLEVQKLAEQKKIQLLTFLSSEAVKRFNQLYESGKKVVAFIHTTC
jgi:hypothetical protein